MVPVLSPVMAKAKKAAKKARKADLAKKAKEAEKNKNKAAIYCRTSSKANRNSASTSRQKMAAKRLADVQRSKVVKTIAEIVSGSLPLDQRSQFTKLMDMGAADKLDKIYFESTRAIARDADVAEAAYKTSKHIGVQLVPADLPELCTLNPNAVQTFLRRVMFAMVELEKNLIVERLEDGRKRKANKVAKEIQDAKKKKRRPRLGLVALKGGPKSCGIASTLEAIGKLSQKKVKDLRQAIKDRDQGEFGWRTLQKKMSTILNINLGSHERARRVSIEFKRCYM